MIKCIFKTSDHVSKNTEPETRSSSAVLGFMMEEVGELATEVNIQAGHSNKESGEDGILGESVDVIITAIDMIHVNYPLLTEEDIVNIVQKKCAKWIKNKVVTISDEII